MKNHANTGSGSSDEAKARGVSAGVDVNLAVVRGRVLRSVDVRSLPTGESIASFDIRVAVDSGPSETVPVVVSEPSATVLKLTEGTVVVVIGRVRRRFFRVGGQTQSRTEVVAERVVRTTASKQLGALRRDLVEAASAV